MSIFSGIVQAPRDPIFGITEAYNADSAANKVNLGVGVYLDDTGRVPLMKCVNKVEQELAASSRPRGYLTQIGIPAYNAAVQELVFGSDSSVLQDARVATFQSLGGTGALRVGAAMLFKINPQATVLLSDPSWENHEAIFAQAGFQVGRYRYYDTATCDIDFDAMLADLAAATPGTIVVLHACCHNPTGYDLKPAQWDRVVAVIEERELVPFVDFAYQGLAAGIDQDRYLVDALAQSGMPFLVANSFSKTFGLYGERVGTINFVATDADEAKKVLSQAKTIVRAMYSNPPTQGGAIVTTILTTPELKACWDQELANMKNRIKAMRAAFRSGLEQAGVTSDLSYITSQAGLFSYSGLSVDQMQRLRNEFHVYGLDSGRLCVAALNPQNIEHVIASVATVMV